MKISLKTKVSGSFFIIVVITGAVASWTGAHLFGTGIMREAQKKVEMDMNSAREIYQRKVDDVRTLVRLTADRFFIKDALIWGNIKALNEPLESIRETEGLDILTLADNHGRVIVRTRNSQVTGDSQANDELVSKVLAEKRVVASTQIISKDELMKEGGELTSQAHMDIIPTPKAKPTEKKEETSGMLIKAAAPIMDGNKLLGVLYGGELLNRDYEIVDKVKDIVFRDEKYEDKSLGTATIFQNDLRISTNVKTQDGERAIGTRVSEEVYEQVLEKGKPWFARAFVVNDWYITAYEPIRNIENAVIGILYVGILEQKFVDLRRRTLLIFLGITVVGALISLVIANLLTNRIIKPIKCLVVASKEVAQGNLDTLVTCKPSKDEVGELEVTFNSMVFSLKERDEKLKEYAEQERMRSEKLVTLGQLAAGVAHEINNPLAVILGRAEFLASEIGDADPVIVKSINTIEHEAEKAASTVRNFLSFARQPEPKLELVELNKLLENAITLALHQALIEKITVVKNLDDNIPKVVADPQQIQQVFINVILNAFQSMPGGGKLFVSNKVVSTTGVENNYAETKFIDTGCGIPKEHISKVFGPFFTTKKRGTGLGLAICKTIIDKHSGSIEIESELNKGTTVTIKLPITGDRSEKKQGNLDK